MALQLEEPEKKVKTCSFKRLHDSLDEDDIKTLTSWLDSKISAYKIFQALKRDGHSIGRQTVYEHVNGWCICGSQ